MVILKGKKKTIVFGYGDVIVASRTTGLVGNVNLQHFPEGLGRKTGILDPSSEEYKKERTKLVNIQFDNVNGIDLFINQLQELKTEMLFNKLDGLLKDVRSRTEFPTKE